MPPVEVPDAVREEFAAWFRSNFVKLCADLMRIGVSSQEAQDAAALAAEDLLRRWEKVDHPYAYARKAALRSVFKSRERSGRELQREVLQGAVAVSREDRGLTAWEDREWVMSLLGQLPSAQREVMACVVDQFTPAETAQLLGRTPAAVRRALADARKRLREDLAVWRAEVVHLGSVRPRRSEEGG
jgi:RNA polymerase sigma factor (sigma-70 family)